MTSDRPMTPDEARAMAGAFTAFERTDGDEFYDGVTWVTMFDERDFEAEDSPFEVREVVMVPVTVRTFPVGVHEFDPCDDDPDECLMCSGERESMFHAPREGRPDGQ